MANSRLNFKDIGYPAPHIEQEGDSTSYTWSNRRYYVNFMVEKDGSGSWFCRDVIQMTESQGTFPSHDPVPKKFQGEFDALLSKPQPIMASRNQELMTQEQALRRTREHELLIATIERATPFRRLSYGVNPQLRPEDYVFLRRELEILGYHTWCEGDNIEISTEKPLSPWDKIKKFFGR